MSQEHEGFIIYPTYRVEDNKSYVYLFGRLKNGQSFCTKNYYEPFFYINGSDLTKAMKLGTFKSEPTDLKSFKEEPLIKIILKIPKQVPDLRKSFEENGIDCFEADVRFAYRFMMENNLKGSLKIIGEPIEKEKYSEINKEEIRTDLFFDEPKIKESNYKPDKKDFKILSFDIESSMDLKNLYCISLVSNDEKLNEVLIVSKDKNLKNAICFDNEEEVLKSFKEKLIAYDPDIITGWNLIDFDLKMISDKFKKYKIDFDLGRTKDNASLKIYDSFMTDSKADIPGRSVLDGIHMLKTSFIKLDDYKLGTAAKKFTKAEKLIEGEDKGEDIENAFKDNQQKLIDYNLLDSKLVIDIIYNSGAMELTILRSLLTGMPLDRVRASIASLDSLYLRRLKERGYAAHALKFSQREQRTTGGYVMKSKPGIYNYVIVLDFKSLYPSLMITFNLDPLTHRPNCKPIKESDGELIKAPNNTCFARELGVLPEILKELWTERDKAKKNKDELSRYAIKILMNSFYGVMASPNCRFYSFELTNSITGFAHKWIKETAEKVRKKGFEVIYGDTDSVFVHLNAKSNEEAQTLGKEIEKEINTYFKKKIKDDYKLDSFMELEFEKTYKKFLMPKQRGSEEGAKKRYAGLLLVNSDQNTGKQNTEDGTQNPVKGTQNADSQDSDRRQTDRRPPTTERMDFTGLEFVRRDWTEVSKKFQLTLLDKIFHEQEVGEYVKEFVTDLKAGKYDDLLVYRKALRKNTEDYTKTTPPHVKAARKLDKITSNIIDYVMTMEGPEPIQKIEHSLDYNHYIEKQIKPIADSVLGFYDQDFDDLIAGSEQKSLFNY